MALAGAIHLLLTPQHAAERPAYGVFFFAAAGRLPAGALAASEHAVVARVRRLLQPPAPPPAWVPGMYLLAAVVLASPAVLLAAPAIAAG